MTILAIDPGNIQSAYVFMADDYRPLQFGKVVNEDLLAMLTDPFCNCPKFDRVVIEKMSSYGMPVGAEVLDTCEWVGKYEQAARVPAIKILRKDVKKAICGGKRGNDSTVIAALQDRFGGKGTKDNKGWFYGFRADVWQAYAVGTAYLDKLESEEKMAEMSFQDMSDTGIDLTLALAEVKTLTEEVERLKKENRTLRNELCQKCGQYRDAHYGACDGCRWMA